MIIPSDDMEWAIAQKPSVTQLWKECWLADPYGSRWMQINTNLKDRAFRSGRKSLTDAGLFIFKREVSIRDGRETVCWMVRNLHGARVKEFWKIGGTDMPIGGTDMPIGGTDMPIGGTDMPIGGTAVPPISPETTQNQGFREASVTSQEHLSNSSKEVLRCGDEKISRAEEGAADFSGGEKQPRERSEPEVPKKSPSQDRKLVNEGKCSAAPKTEKLVDFDPTRKGNSPVDLEKLKQENAYLDALKQDPEHQAAVKSVLAQCKQKLLNSPHLSQHCVEKRRAVRQVKLDQWVESLSAPDWGTGSPPDLLGADGKGARLVFQF